MKFSIYQESRQGPRKANQDRVAYCYSRDSLCMIIADGMGGHLHGEVAAQIATQFIAEAFQRQATPRIEEPFRFLLDTIMNAHLAIIDYANVRGLLETPRTDRKSTRLNSSHVKISYAVFCLKKKKKEIIIVTNSLY